MLRTKEVCRKIYNRFLEEYYSGEQNRWNLQANLPLWKESDKDLAGIYSKLPQYELHRLFTNIRILKEMENRGRKVGKLRFKGEHWFKSFTYNQSGFKILPKNDKFGFLHLSKIGDIPIRIHRPILGLIKQVTIKHVSSGKWYAFIQIDDGSKGFEQLEFEDPVGIDVGLETYIVDSNCCEIDNPRHLKQALKKLRKEHRQLSRRQKGSKNYEKQRIKLARLHEHLCNQRNDFQHKLSRYYVDNFDLIVTEKLHPSNMVKNRKLSRSISDAAWSSFNQMLAYKAERAGKLFVQVDARGTSQECSRCGKLVPKSLSDRWHDCLHCGLHLSRDHNASINILNRGIEKVRSERPELTLVDSRPLHGSANPMQADWLKQEMPPLRAA